MSLGVLQLTENMKLLLTGWIRCSFRVFPGHFYCIRGPSLVELTGYDSCATSTVAVIRMSPNEYVWPSHIYSREYGSIG